MIRNPTTRILNGLAALGVLVAILAPAAPARAQKFDEGLSSPFGTQEVVDPLTVSAKLDKQALIAGDQAVIAVILEFAPHWHAWPSAEQDVLPDEVADFAIRTEITLVDQPAWIATVGPVQWPKPTPALVPDLSNIGQSIEVPVYQGRAIAYIPLVLSDSIEPGQATLRVNVWYQACDESQCQRPDDIPVRTTAQLVASIDEAAALNVGEVDADFQDFDPAIYAAILAGEVAATLDGASSAGDGAAPTGSTFFGYSLPRADGPVGVVLVALLAALGGFILNLTPCVLPVIPIKIMTISHHAGSPGKSLILGLWMAAGVIAFWLSLGVIAASFTMWTDPSRIFGIWWFTLGIGVLIGAMGVGLMGMFTFQLPQAVHKINPKADSVPGSFMFGVMTAVLGLPCFGFVAGALLAGSATMPTAMILTIFAAIGVGMAAPYLVLSARPSWVKKIPQTGPASDLVKQMMGLLLLAAAAYFVGSAARAVISENPSFASGLPWWSTVVHWWVVALFAAFAGLWLIVRTFLITPRWGRRIVFSVIGVIVGGVAVLYVADATNKSLNNYWVPYADEALASAIENDQVVVIDFTAEWCLNCKVLKATVLNREPVKAELLKLNVVAMSADLTSISAPGWEKLRSLGQTGIPLLAIYGPETEGPWMANAYTPDQVMEALMQARGRLDDWGSASAPANVTPTSASN